MQTSYRTSGEQMKIVDFLELEVDVERDELLFGIKFFEPNSKMDSDRLRISPSQSFGTAE